jgi:hypothetical protein
MSQAILKSEDYQIEGSKFLLLTSIDLVDFYTLSVIRKAIYAGLTFVNGLFDGVRED